MANLSGFKPLTVDQWKSFAADHPGLKHYVSMVERPGNLVLMAAVEYYLFPPSTPTTRNFHVNIVDWQKAAWNVFSAPKQQHEEIVETAKALAMKITSGPPAMLFLGESAMLFSPPPHANEAEIKAAISTQLPPQLVNAFKGLERFPGDRSGIHGIENDHRLLSKPLSPSEFSQIRERETKMHDTLAFGIRPSLQDIAAYVYGKNRVLPTSRLK